MRIAAAAPATRRGTRHTVRVLRVARIACGVLLCGAVAASCATGTLVGGEVGVIEPLTPPEPERPYESIAAMVALGDAGAAIGEYERLYRERPEDYETRLLYARLLVMAGRGEEARTEIAALRTERGDEPEALFLLALIEGIDGDKDKQRAFLETVLRLDPRHADTLSVLGDLLLVESENDEAKDLFEAALDADPGNTVALQGMAQLASGTKDWVRAADLLTTVLAEEPDNVLAYVDRARAYRESGDRPAAIADLSRAIELDPEYYWSYIDRAQIRIERGELRDAIGDLNNAVRLDPEYFLAFVLRGQTHYRLGSIPEAAGDLGKAVELRPDYFYAYQPLGTCLYMEERYEEARKAFERAWDKQPQDTSLPLLAALSLKKAGREADARAYMTRVMAGLDRSSWQYEVARFYAGPSNDFYIVSATNRERRPIVKYRLLFYLASQHLLEGKRRSALAYFTEVGELTEKLAFTVPSPEKRLAEWELGRMGDGG